MSEEEMLAALRRCNEVAIRAMKSGHHPFGAILIGPDHKTVLLEHGNVSTVRHAETELARLAAETYTPHYLWECTLVTTFEPCAMCTGTSYWANIGRILYGVSESKLLALTGKDDRNPTLALPCRDLIATGQKKIEIYGPFAEVEEEIIAPHRSFWNQSH